MADPVPVFVIKASDRLALRAIYAYQNLCFQYGLSGQAAEVEKALEEMRLWRADHLDQIKMPSHVHVPVAIPIMEDHT